MPLEPIITKIGKRGTMVVPAALRHQYGLDEGTSVITEARPDGVLIKPVEMVVRPMTEPTKKHSQNVWQDWFEIAQTMNLTHEDVTTFKNTGRRS